MMQENFAIFNGSIGEVNLSTVKTVYSRDAKLYVITAEVKGSIGKKYILSVDERKIGTKYTKSLFETNIPKNLKKEDYSAFNGYAKFSSLENNKDFVNVEITNGIKIVTNGIKIVTESNNGSYQSNLASPLTDCIKTTLRDMSIGEWAIFIVGEPETMAALVLACAMYPLHQPHQLIFSNAA